MTPLVMSGKSTPVNETPKINGTAVKTENSTKRIDLEKLVLDFQRKLGENWDKYQSALCLFLLGKLSRQELNDELITILDRSTIRMHNQLLLANLANSLRDSPTVGLSSVGFGGPLSKKQKRKTSSQYEKIKKDIMALPPRERRRLKNIQRDSGKKNMITSSLTMTRQELLPKIPLISKNNLSNGMGTDVRINNTALWTQEIIQGISTLNAAESYEMPDSDSLHTKITAIMREHGLIGKINDDVTKIISLGLETHLKSLMESMIDVVRYRKRLYASDELLDTVSPNSSKKAQKNKKIIVTLDDLFDTFEQLPLLIDVGGPSMRLSTSMLRNDDDNDYLDDPVIEEIEETKIDPDNTAIANADSSQTQVSEKNEEYGTRNELKQMLKSLLTS